MQTEEQPGSGFVLPDELCHWARADAPDIGRRPVLGNHRLSEMALFSDDGLIELLDVHPHERLEVYTMSTNPEEVDEFRPVLLGGASGAEIFRAVERGRLWLNVIGVRESDARFGAIHNQLFDEVRRTVPDLGPMMTNSTLVIGSPTAIVSYHADAAPNFLWHIRGDKLLRVYPFGEPFVDRDCMEDIFAAMAPEEMPFSYDFDDGAQAFHLKPGEVLSWAQNQPHRIVNEAGVNVSLSTEYETEATLRRRTTWCANRFWRRKAHLPTTSTRETGATAATKRFTYRVCRKLGMDKPVSVKPYVAVERIDPDAPLGISPLDRPTPTEFGFH